VTFSKQPWKAIFFKLRKGANNSLKKGRNEEKLENKSEPIPPTLPHGQ
jgi:hypothetical protein